MGKWENAQEQLLSALKLRIDSKLSHVDKALESILVGSKTQKHIILHTNVKGDLNILFNTNKKTKKKNKLSCMQKQKLFPLVVIRPELLFKPNKHYVAELEKKDYLGKAKVSNHHHVRAWSSQS